MWIIICLLVVPSFCLITIEVHPQSVPCQESVCLQVRQKGYYAFKAIRGIDNFVWMEGFHYWMDVDDSNGKYLFRRLIQKNTQRPQPNPLQGTWMVQLARYGTKPTILAIDNTAFHIDDCQTEATYTARQGMISFGKWSQHNCTQLISAFSSSVGLDIDGNLLTLFSGVSMTVQMITID